MDIVISNIAQQYKDASPASQWICFKVFRIKYLSGVLGLSKIFEENSSLNPYKVDVLGL